MTNDSNEGKGDDRQGRSTRDGGGGRTTLNNVRRQWGGPGSMTPGNTHPCCKMRKTVGEGVGYDSKGMKPPATTADCCLQVLWHNESLTFVGVFFFYFFSLHKPPHKGDR
jgi:hypothetical protein